ncbi:hypothetical protein XM53_21280 [Roseovarius atlanticus]|uniref:DUF7684 domain-containing protein n=1 Tax=Roseovarius atlanticus TaxID=1641875 RepID=A0A0T5NP34_9RHOB|nr:hypothetical protein XM53_21280 [Roseovarius atlanticus]
MLLYHYVDPTTPVSLPRIASPYKCVVLIERQVSAEARWQVSKDLVASGCRYMLAWGLECSLWDDSVDMANLEQFGYGDVPPEHFVMTTWHSDETLPEVLHFARRHATQTYDDVALDRCLILDFSAAPREPEIRALYDAGEA